MPEFLLPDLGEGLEDAEIVAWRVQVGDTVTVDQIVVEVETAKAAVEIPVPYAGTVTALHAGPGTSLPVGTPLLHVAETVSGAVKTDPVEPGLIEAGFHEPGVVVGEQAEGSGNVLIGYGTSEPTRNTRRRRRPAPSRRLIATPEQPHRTTAVGVISPLVRRLAHDAGLDLTRLTPSYPDGVLRRADIDEALRTAAATTAAPAANETRVPIRGLRRAVADKLSRSRREIPEATVWVDVDATELLAARAAINARDGLRPVSVLGLLARFTTLALRRYPELNATIEHDEIVIPDHVHLGFAAQTDRGLVVPVIRNAHELTTRDLAAAIADRTAAARGGTLGPAELTGSTITINNYGVFGVDGSAAIINYPEVAIIGIGRIMDRPWVVDNEIRIRKIAELTLAFDHRVCDGGTAGGFLRFIADCIESPIAALGEL